MTGTHKYIPELERYIAEMTCMPAAPILFEKVLVSEPLQKETDIGEFLGKRRKEAFREMLFQRIDQSGLTDAAIYRKAGMDRRHFSKIRSNGNYRPSKLTVVSLILALELNVEDAEELLEAGGYSLSFSDTSDLIFRFCLEKEIYDLFEVNELLDHYDQKALG